jgi:dethiobiotin synthetase
LSPAQALLRLRRPVAPPLAADQEDVAIDWDHLMSLTTEASNGYECALIEGAGGLLSPLTWRHNNLDMALDLEAQVLLVASDRLGTINHTLLTLQALEHAGLEVVGVVMSAPQVPDDSTGSNAASLERSWGQSRVLAIPRADSLDAAAAHVKPILSWCTR